MGPGCSARYRSARSERSRSVTLLYGIRARLPFSRPFVTGQLATGGRGPSGSSPSLLCQASSVASARPFGPDCGRSASSTFGMRLVPAGGGRIRLSRQQATALGTSGRPGPEWAGPSLPCGEVGNSVMDAKQAVKDYWDDRVCGERYLDGDGSGSWSQQARRRYELLPYLRSFASFEDGADEDVLEVGVGAGADFVSWLTSSPRSLVGVDFTEPAVRTTWERIEGSDRSVPVLLAQADAENLPFSDGSFDIVYSWGVLHHTPDTQRAVDEIRRVLRPQGCARIMLYHLHSVTAFALWVRHALFALHPRRSLREVVASHMESPGTKAFSKEEAAELFSDYSNVDISVQLSFGDLLRGKAGEGRHSGPLLDLVRHIWPRGLLRRWAGSFGHNLLIKAAK